MPTLTPSRVVALLTPVFAALGSALSVGVASLLPVNLSPDAITGLLVAGATTALAGVLAWFKGWWAHEARTPAGRAATLAAHEAETVAHTVGLTPEMVQAIVEKAISTLPGVTSGEVQKIVEGEIAKLAGLLHKPKARAATKTPAESPPAASPAAQRPR